MPSLLSRVIGTIREHGLAPGGAFVVVALSGGSDSVALASLLGEAAEAGVVRLAALAHFDHGIRGEAAECDARFCAGLAERMSVPFDLGRGDVPALARARHLSPEDAARQARYAFLEQARVRAGAERIAVGHTRDDQAETFLLRILRGAGTRGLAGIHPRAGRVIRPLINCGRDELRQYLAERGLTYCEDGTNDDVRIPRNRLRHDILPVLRRHFNPALDATLAREAAIAREDAAWLEQLTGEACGRLAVASADSWRLAVEPLGRAPRALARRVVHRALTALAGGRFIGYDHIDAVLRLCEGAGGIDLPGQRAERIGGEVVLTSRCTLATRPQAAGFLHALPVPGAVVVPEAGSRISAALVDGASAALAEPGALAGGGHTAVVPARLLTAGLMVRSRQAGDRFRPAGLDGHQKLQDFLVNRKVARQNRDRVPLVVDASNRIVWVAGHRLAEEFRVTDRTAGMVILKLEAWGGRA